MTDISKYPNALPLSFEPFYSEPEYNRHRRMCVIVFSDVLNAYDQFRQHSYREKMAILRDIEAKCYENIVEECIDEDVCPRWENVVFVQMYNTACYELTCNMDDRIVEGNELLLDVIFEEQDFTKLAAMTPEDMKPDLHMPIKKALQERMLIKIEHKVSTSHQCPKCLEYKVHVQDVQKRALDECPSEEIRCLNCHYFWINM
jgi:DNA-directed RNA polymerase subunit M/transcription elongation factor TFIIS